MPKLNMPLRFDVAHMERVWGGTALRQQFNLDTPADKVTGEAWLLSDHEEHCSRVVEGPFKGKSLQELLQEFPDELLGERPEPTIHGQFPLLLKLLDTSAPLSVQVHPDDALAQELGEPDVGKTEMWHVLHAAPDSELICGLQPNVGPSEFEQAIQDDTIGDLLCSFPSPPGTSVFVPAGTVHAIGSDLLIAEIQQNSNLTYRVYDWGRVGLDGKPRELHIEKATKVSDFTGGTTGASTSMKIERHGNQGEILSACQYFAAEKLQVERTMERVTDGKCFHIILCTESHLVLSLEGHVVELHPGQSALVPGVAQAFTLDGAGTCLDYYVPDIESDIIKPLEQAGYSEEEIQNLVAQ